MSRNKKPRKKKNSRAARDQRMFADARVWMWESEPSPEGHDHYLHAQRRAMAFGWCNLSTPSVIENLLHRPRNWVVCGRALVRKPDGTMWMEQADFTITSRGLLDVEGAYDAVRAAVMEANQTRDVFDCGWIAQSWVKADPSRVDPDWVYHDAPPELAPKNIPVGAAYSEERYQRWQEFNRERNSRLVSGDR